MNVESAALARRVAPLPHGLVEGLSRGGTTTALILVNLNEFGLVNLAYGHEIADEALKRVGLMMGTVLPPNAQLWRLSGDNFAVLVRGSVEEAAQLAKALTASVQGLEFADGSAALREAARGVNFTGTMQFGLTARAGVAAPMLGEDFDVFMGRVCAAVVAGRLLPASAAGQVVQG